MESETQTTDIENDASLQEYDEILNGRHEMTGITRLWVSWMFPFTLTSSVMFLMGVSDWQFIILNSPASPANYSWATWTIKYYSIAFYR